MKFPTLMTVSLLAASALCLDVRYLTVPTSSGRHYGVSAGTISNYLSTGMRLVDIEVELSEFEFVLKRTVRTGPSPGLTPSPNAVKTPKSSRPLSVSRFMSSGL